MRSATRSTPCTVPVKAVPGRYVDLGFHVVAAFRMDVPPSALQGYAASLRASSSCAPVGVVAVAAEVLAAPPPGVAACARCVLA